MYEQYDRKNIFPKKRTYLHLAQIALVVARTGGAADARLSDFMFEERDQVDIDPAEAIGFNPRKN